MQITTVTEGPRRQCYKFTDKHPQTQFASAAFLAGHTAPLKNTLKHQYEENS